MIENEIYFSANSWIPFVLCSMFYRERIVLKVNDRREYLKTCLQNTTFLNSVYFLTLTFSLSFVFAFLHTWYRCYSKFKLMIVWITGLREVLPMLVKIILVTLFDRGLFTSTCLIFLFMIFFLFFLRGRASLFQNNLPKNVISW